MYFNKYVLGVSWCSEWSFTSCFNPVLSIQNKPIFSHCWKKHWKTRKYKKDKKESLWNTFSETSITLEAGLFTTVKIVVIKILYFDYKIGYNVFFLIQKMEKENRWLIDWIWYWIFLSGYFRSSSLTFSCMSTDSKSFAIDALFEF